MRVGVCSGDVRRTVTAVAALSAVVTSAAFSLEEASALYRERFGKSPASVQEAGDYLFVIQEGVLDDNTDAGWNRVILTGQREALSGYVGKSTAPVISPFGKDLTDQLTAIGSFSIPSCRMCKVEEIRYRGRYRHVSAFEAPPLRKAKEAARSEVPVSRTTDEWVGLIREKLSALPSARERKRFWSQVGATIPCLLESGGLEWQLNAADGVAVEELLSRWTGKEGERDCFAALGVFPTFLRAQTRLSEIAEQAGDYRRALIRRFVASASAPDPSGVMRIARLADGREQGVWCEYARLYAEVLERSDAFAKAKEPMWRYELNTFGHLCHMSVGGPDEGAEKAFREAKVLFSRGQDLPRILSLLSESLSRRSDNAEKWRYYAAALRASDKPHDAVIAYHQALALSPADFLAQQDLCLLYDRLGFSGLAKGNAWFVAAACPDAARREKVIRAILK